MVRSVLAVAITMSALGMWFFVLLPGRQLRQAQISECQRQYHFVHSYTQSLDQMRDLVSLARRDPASFAVADGKMRDLIHHLDDLATSLPEKKLIIEERSQVEAYESCRRWGMRRCMDAGDAALERETSTSQEIMDSLKPCDRFDLPAE